MKPSAFRQRRENSTHNDHEESDLSLSRLRRLIMPSRSSSRIDTAGAKGKFANLDGKRDPLLRGIATIYEANSKQ